MNTFFNDLKDNEQSSSAHTRNNILIFHIKEEVDTHIHICGMQVTGQSVVQ